MGEDKIFFLLFRSIHDVLKTEKLLKKTSAVFELVPVPRKISSECGICIKSPKPPKEILPDTGAPEVDRCYVYNGTDYIVFEIEA